MEELNFFTTYAEYEFWLIEHKEVLLPYFKKNDVPLKSLQMNVRAYNALRINNIINLSDIIFLSNEEISALDMMDKSSVNEVIMYKRNYLRKNKRAISYYIAGNKEFAAKAPVEKPQSEVELNEEAEKSSDFSENNQNREMQEKASESEKNLNSSELYDIPKSENAEAKLELSHSSINIMLNDSKIKNKLIEFTASEHIGLDSLDLSTRSYNVLRRRGIKYLYEAMACYPQEISSLKNVGAKSADEIGRSIEKYISEHFKQITAYLDGEEIGLDDHINNNTVPEAGPFELSIPQLIMHPAYKEKARKYLKENDIPVEQMGLSVRAVNAFMRANIFSFFDALSINPYNLSSIRNIGVKSINEIKSRMEYYLSKLQPIVAAYCCGDEDAMYSDDYIEETVIACFKDMGFNGISYRQIRETFPEDIDEARIKKCIGRLIANKKLEYVDFRLYRVYPSLNAALEKSNLYEEDKDIIYKRLSGMTLEAIAQEYDLTRERIRQKFEKKIRKLRAELQIKCGSPVFDEDYYAYLYSNYEGDRELWNDFLGVPPNTISYLYNTQVKGKKSIRGALSDPNIDLVLKLKIQNYLNRNKILLDGTLIERNQKDLEDFVLSKIATDELTFDEFKDKYNEFLKANNVDDKSLYYTDDMSKYRSGRLSNSMFSLWKQGERLRYYDISAQDYTQLLEELNLESFKNTEISTLKLFNDHSEIMQKYDIRDHYELHNLLKKIVDKNNYNDIQINKQPMIRFGEFDREKAIFEIISAFSPITLENLTDYVYSEYGYDRATAQATYFQPFRDLLHNGIYSVEFKQVPADRIEALKSYLPNEFYYISEIKEIYGKIFKDADTEEINHRSLKALGYKVFNNYVLKSYSHAAEYFRDELMKNDIFSLKDFNTAYGNLGSYQTALYDLRKNYDIMLFAKDQYINFRRLEKFGILKGDIKDYCQRVYDDAENDEYLTAHSLKAFGLESKLDSLGLDGIFYIGILEASDKFASTQIFGETLLYKGNADSKISKKSFILSQLSKYSDVDFEQFNDDCFDSFGIKVPGRYDVIEAISGTDFYYDEIMDKFYINKEVYYSEFDD